MRLWLKIAMVLGMTLAILVPLAMVNGLVQERQAYRRQAVADIARSYAGAQTFGGPVLVVPYRETVKVEQPDRLGNVHTVQREVERQWTFFPKVLTVAGQLKPGMRRRGLYEVRVYEWQGSVEAVFDVSLPVDPADGGDRRIGQPYLSYAISDVHGIAGVPGLQVGGRKLEVEQGRGGDRGEGLHALLEPLQPGQSRVIKAELQLVLAGTERFALVPLGDENRFLLGSAWPHPRFDGSSPRIRSIGADGFQAQWDIPGVATNAQQRYLAGWKSAHDGDDADATSAIDTVSVALVDPVDAYSKTDRATKYGLLFVLLTFVGFFMFELTRQLPIHPIQYGLVGLALVIFFLLLLSLSEHFAFSWSYLAAGIACIGLITFYLSAVLRSVVRALGFAAMLTTLYGALYGLLVSEDNALVLGAGLLFVILTALMAMTRKVDWYQLGGSMAMPGATAPDQNARSSEAHR